MVSRAALATQYAFGKEQSARAIAASRHAVLANRDECGTRRASLWSTADVRAAALLPVAASETSHAETPVPLMCRRSCPTTMRPELDMPADHRAHTRTLKVGRQSIRVANADKILYPAARFPKSAVIAYYVAVSRYILPHLRNRPVALKRYPNGIHGESFWEKDAPSFTPRWVKTASVPRRDRNEPPINYILVNDRRTLAWAASIASLEFHPFLHRVPALDTPTAIVFDLDPGEGCDVLACARVALLLRGVLERMRLESFPKVSGSKGIQVYVPLNAPVTYAITQPFARTVALLLAQEHPQLIIAEMARSAPERSSSTGARTRTTRRRWRLLAAGEAPSTLRFHAGEVAGDQARARSQRSRRAVLPAARGD